MGLSFDVSGNYLNYKKAGVDDGLVCVGVMGISRAVFVASKGVAPKRRISFVGESLFIYRCALKTCSLITGDVVSRSFSVVYHKRCSTYPTPPSQKHADAPLPLESKQTYPSPTQSTQQSGEKHDADMCRTSESVPP